MCLDSTWRVRPVTKSCTASASRRPSGCPSVTSSATSVSLMDPQLLDRLHSGARLRVDALAMRRSHLASLAVELWMCLVWMHLIDVAAAADVDVHTRGCILVTSLMQQSFESGTNTRTHATLCHRDQRPVKGQINARPASVPQLQSFLHLSRVSINALVTTRCGELTVHTLPQLTHNLEHTGRTVSKHTIRPLLSASSASSTVA